MIFVTGGTGLVGSHLLYDLVQKGISVKALQKKGSNIEEVRKVFSYYSKNGDELFSKITWAEGDILDSFSLNEAMDDVTQIYHCAAIVSMEPKDGKRMIQNNVTGTANILNLALTRNVTKFCHVSSVATLGAEYGKEISEETPWNEESNLSAYAISKYLSENEVWRASEEGLNTIIVNPSIIIGPGNWNKSSGLIFSAASKGLSWYASGGMGYVDVRDVAKSMIALMESEITNQRFIISSENHSFKDLFTLVNKALHKEIPNKRATKPILELAWRADKVRSILTGAPHYFTKAIARHAAIQLSYSNKKIRNTLKTDFIPVLEAISHAGKHFLQDLNQGNK